MTFNASLDLPNDVPRFGIVCVSWSDDVVKGRWSFSGFSRYQWINTVNTGMQQGSCLMWGLCRTATASVHLHFHFGFPLHRTSAKFFHLSYPLFIFRLRLLKQLHIQLHTTTDIYTHFTTSVCNHGRSIAFATRRCYEKVSISHRRQYDSIY